MERRGHIAIILGVAWTVAVVLVMVVWLDFTDEYGERIIPWAIWLAGFAVGAVVWGAVELGIRLWRRASARFVKPT